MHFRPTEIISPYNSNADLSVTSSCSGDRPSFKCIIFIYKLLEFLNRFRKKNVELISIIFQKYNKWILLASFLWMTPGPSFFWTFPLVYPGPAGGECQICIFTCLSSFCLFSYFLVSVLLSESKIFLKTQIFLFLQFLQAQTRAQAFLTSPTFLKILFIFITSS